jgi:hypothetical protein
MKKYFYFTLFLLLGCESFQPSVQVLPSHIKKIAIGQFVNKTNIYGLEEKLKLDTINEFILDGRFEIVSDPNNSDGYVTGEILYYILQPTAYGPNYEVQQYKLRLILNFYFVDRIKNVTLWEEPNIEEVLYFPAATLPGGLTEEEAKNTILSNMAKKIYIRTIEGFGSVTGTSYKKVPQK